MWTAAGATGYRVYRGTTAGFMGESPAPWATPDTPTAVDPTVPGMLLFHVVRAIDGTAESAD